MSGTDASRYADIVREFGLGEEDVAAWQKSSLPDEAFEDWLTDRVARRPSGTRAREIYGGDDVHAFARRAILDVLVLGDGDHLLEIGCGGGALLREALATGARVTGLDHSDEMVELARDRAPRAGIVHAKAEALPFADRAFTALAMSIVFIFFDDPIAVLCECQRVLRPEGRLAIYTTGPEFRGTPAAPEPLASHGHFYADQELTELARRAGLADARVSNDRGGQLLTARA